MDPERKENSCSSAQEQTGSISIANLVSFAVKGIDSESGEWLVKYVLKDTNGAVKDGNITLTGILELVKREIVSSEDAAKIIRKVYVPGAQRKVEMKVVTIRNFEMPESCSGCRFLEVFAEGGRISGQCRMTGVFEYDRQALDKRRMECCMLEELDVLGWRKTGGKSVRKP